MEGAKGNIEYFDLTKKRHFSDEKVKQEDEGEDEEMELSLGLSMNGRFGVDPTRTTNNDKRLKRASSISDLAFAVGPTNNGPARRARGAHAPLSRTRSLPAETAEEWRRRKEAESMRRMEARKKRMEKLKNVRVLKDNKENCVKDSNGKVGLHEGVNGQRVDNFNGGFNKFESGNGVKISSSQGSVGLIRSGSSGSSDFIQGPNPNADVSPSNRHRSPEQEPASRTPDKNPKGTDKLVKNPMLDMPYVTTKECGPNGRRVEGFLYAYKKGEDVRIVCVCHGTFLTPKEFVNHGGGGVDVENPLKHIVVNPFHLL